MTVLTAQACVSCNNAHDTNSLQTYVSVLVLCTCQTATLGNKPPELTLQGIVRHDGNLGKGGSDPLELELRSGPCMSQCC